jgi:hypothetical protein
MLEVDIPGTVVQERQVYTMISTTMDLYSHVAPGYTPSGVRNLRKMATFYISACRYNNHCSVECLVDIQCFWVMSILVLFTIALVSRTVHRYQTAQTAMDVKAFL